VYFQKISYSEKKDQSFWLNRSFALVVLFVSSQLFAQKCPETFVPPCTVKGVEITTSSTGSSQIYTSAFTSCGVSTLSNGIWLGSAGEFTYTMTFSKPIKEIVVILTASGNTVDENFIFNTNAGVPKIESSNSCFSRIVENQIFSGAASASDGGGGIFTVKTTAPFTTMTISGDGGENGSILSFCSSSIQSTNCSLAEVMPQLSETAIKGTCGVETVDLKTIKAKNLAVGAIVTWHSALPVSDENTLTDLAVTAGTYFAAYLDSKQHCYSRAIPIIVSIPPIPVVNAGDDQTIRSGESVNLWATGAAIFTWDEGVIQGKAFSPSYTKTYTVTGKNEQGCSATDQVVVTVETGGTPTLAEVPIETFDTSLFKSVNIVFVLDISSSMSAYGKIDLLKLSMTNLLELIRPEDRIAIVTYSSKANVILPPTSGNDKDLIIKTVEALRPFGHTAGAAGIKRGFQQAKKTFIPGGTNLVVVITDGAFTSKSGNYLKAIEKYKQQGIYLSVVGIKNAHKDEENMREAATLGNGEYVPVFKEIDAEQNLILEIKRHAFRY